MATDYVLRMTGALQIACPPREILDSVSNPCVKAQLNLALTAKTTILTMLNNTFGGTVPFEDLSLSFKDATNLSATVDGEQQRLSGIEFEIRLNKNILSNASKEYITATIYHEILHAFLSSKLARGADGKYQNLAQHTEIVNNYITLLSGALRVTFPNLSAQEAWGLSWGGLTDKDIPFYASLPQTQKDTIIDVNTRHRDKTLTNKLGTHCTP